MRIQSLTRSQRIVAAAITVVACTHPPGMPSPSSIAPTHAVPSSALDLDALVAYLNFRFILTGVRPLVQICDWNPPFTLSDDFRHQVTRPGDGPVTDITGPTRCLGVYQPPAGVVVLRVTVHVAGDTGQVIGLAYHGESSWQENAPLIRSGFWRAASLTMSGLGMSHFIAH
jgi:hypothetical protein